MADEVVGTHPCDFSTCFWNNQRKPASKGRCQLVTMVATTYLDIAAHNHVAKTDAANCPRVNETDLLPERVYRAGNRALIRDAPAQDTQKAISPISESTRVQYPPYTGWKPSK